MSEMVASEMVASEMVIRSFVPADAQAFHDLNMQWITILTPGGAIFVAELEKVVGCVALLPMGDSYQVAKMAVAPDAQGRGIGRRLLETAIAWAEEQGAVRLCLGSNTRLAPALHLYESAGFQHLPPERRPVSPYVRADVFMEMIMKIK